MAHAKLSHSAAASLAFVRNLQNEETHTLVRREVFAQVKAAFGIPEKHRIKVELDASKPNYLDIVRKTDGARYELNAATNKWTGAEVVPAVVERPVYVRLDLDDLRDFAIEQADNATAEVVEPREIGYATAEVRLDSYDKGHVWVRVDGNSLSD